MGKKKVVLLLSSALQILQRVAAIFLLVVTPWKLFRVGGFDAKDTPDLVSSPGETFNKTTQCLLSPPLGGLTGSTFCVLVMIFGAATLLFGTLIACTRCICRCASGNACGVANIATIAGDVALAIAWGIAFYLLLQRGRDANDAGFLEKGWRDGCIVMGLVGCVSFAVDAFILVFTLGPS